MLVKLLPAPLKQSVDINGDVIGAAQVDSNGKIKVVSSETIKKFLDIKFNIKNKILEISS